MGQRPDPPPPWCGGGMGILLEKHHLHVPGELFLQNGSDHQMLIEQ